MRIIFFGSKMVHKNNLLRVSTDEGCVMEKLTFMQYSRLRASSGAIRAPA
jgi:hypothetical protein